MTYKFSLPLRGGRNYVHATSLFDTILFLRSTYTILPTDIDFSLRRFSHKEIDLVLDDGGIYNDEDVIGKYRDSYGTITILEGVESLIERVAYDEHSIVNQCKIWENVIQVPKEIESYSFIEKAIAAYKALLQIKFGNSGNFFFFVRLTLHHLPSLDFEISFDRLISGKYFQGSIAIGQEIIGIIYFGVKKI